MTSARILKQSGFVCILGILIASSSVLSLQYQLPIGPVVIILSTIPIIGLKAAKRHLSRALPDMVFGAIDTGILVIPALAGAKFYGIMGAIAGGVIGDALTDGIAGFFEGGISSWLRKKGIEESREQVTTSLGKMAGCLLGAGIILTIASILGFAPNFK